MDVVDCFVTEDQLEVHIKVFFRSGKGTDQVTGEVGPMMNPTSTRPVTGIMINIKDSDGILKAESDPKAFQPGFRFMDLNVKVTSSS